MKTSSFDADYYQRFYISKRTRVAEPEHFDRVAKFTTAYLDMLGRRIDSVLDAGCGLGLLHTGMRQAWPRVSIEAFDPSEYLCRRYGWRCANLASYETDKIFDLVICHDVLQYLDRKAAAVALDRLSQLTGTALLFGVLTREDWQDNCDQDLTDGNVFIRSANWYRKRLRHDFYNAGGGLYIKRDSDTVLYALESL